MFLRYKPLILLQRIGKMRPTSRRYAWKSQMLNSRYHTELHENGKINVDRKDRSSTNSYVKLWISLCRLKRNWKYFITSCRWCVLTSNQIGQSMKRSFKYNQQDATLYNILYYCQCSTCFRGFLRPSPGAQICIHSIWYMSSLFAATASDARSHERQIYETFRSVYICNVT
jgi:hypothetical protein